MQTFKKSKKFGTLLCTTKTFLKFKHFQKFRAKIPKKSQKYI